VTICVLVSDVFRDLITKQNEIFFTLAVSAKLHTDGMPQARREKNGREMELREAARCDDYQCSYANNFISHRPVCTLARLAGLGSIGLVASFFGAGFSGDLSGLSGSAGFSNFHGRSG
jgi:hypothetical protein